MKLYSIQFLRAVAALLVVYAHGIDVQMRYAYSRQQDYFYLQNFGAIGVDIFFCISGFIITYIGDRLSGARLAQDFLVKRFLRINPIYYFASLLYLWLVIWFIWSHHLPYETGYFVSSLIDTFFVFPSASDGTKYIPLLTVAWTLSYEWYFYLVFVLLILSKSTSKPALLIVVMGLLVIIGRILRPEDFRLVLLTNPLILEFLLGVVIYWLYMRVKVPVAVAWLLTLIGAGIYVYEIYFGFGDISEVGNIITAKLSIERFIWWGIPSALLVSGCIFLERNGVLLRLWENRLSRLTGDASYSIYLTHLSVFFLFHSLYEQTGFFLNADLSVFVHLFVAAGIGILFYYYIERPLLHFLQKKYAAKSRTAPVISS